MTHGPQLALAAAPNAKCELDVADWFGKAGSLLAPRCRVRPPEPSLQRARRTAAQSDVAVATSTDLANSSTAMCVNMPEEMWHALALSARGFPCTAAFRTTPNASVALTDENDRPPSTVAARWPADAREAPIAGMSCDECRKGGTDVAAGWSGAAGGQPPAASAGCSVRRRLTRSAEGLRALSRSVCPCCSNSVVVSITCMTRAELCSPFL